MLEMLVSPLGFEPRTKGLKVPCSTAELRARGATLPGATDGTSVTGLTLRQGFRGDDGRDRGPRAMPVRWQT